MDSCVHEYASRYGRHCGQPYWRNGLYELNPQHMHQSTIKCRLLARIRPHKSQLTAAMIILHSAMVSEAWMKGHNSVSLVWCRCCNSTVLDGGGYCCLSGMLDECGVCDGDGSSCRLHVTVTTQALRLPCLFLPLPLKTLPSPPSSCSSLTPFSCFTL